MKTFIYTKQRKGFKATITVYRIKRNIPYYVDYINFNTQSSRGDDSEAYRCLLENNMVSHKLYKEANGYYFRSSDKIKIYPV